VIARSVAWLAAVLVSAGSAPATGADEGGASRWFQVTWDSASVNEVSDGRLFVFLSQRTGEPRFGPNWFQPEPFFAVDVRRFAAGQTRLVDETADSFPDRLSALAAGTYRVQAVFDRSCDSPDPGRGPGNFYSAVQSISVAPGAAFDCALKLDRAVPEGTFPAQQGLHEVVFRSEMLSKFFGREVQDRCAVLLPASYDANADRRYPVVYVVPGFGGRHLQAALQAGRMAAAGSSDVAFIGVGLSGKCRWGHHVYADSATNGPRGRSLVEELIPLVDRRFRTIADPGGRFIAGHSSGGWSALWLQISYPTTFGGCWSLSPDPVDFRDFQQVNLYEQPPLSLYDDPRGDPRPIARRGKTPVLWFRSFARMDDVLARGGQLRSFEAVFSPLDRSGVPRRLWDRTSGTIDPDVATAWEAYDIRLKLERNWAELGPLLRGKLHIATGELDTFYLEGAVKRLASTLQELGSDAEIEIVPGADHGGTARYGRFARIHREMADLYRQSYPPDRDSNHPAPPPVRREPAAP